MNQYRITKYNPAFRDSTGSYMKPEWTAISDIGSCFDGATLKEEDYLTVESAYVESAIRFMTEDRISALRAVGVENNGNAAHAPAEGCLISVRDLPDIIRSALREEFWCRLVCGARFIHFGCDYYMYIAVQGKCESSIQYAHANGLFVEPFESPYHETDDGA